MNIKFLNMLGICKKAGQLSCGSFLTLENIKRNKAKVVYLASDVGDNTKKDIINACKFKNTPVYIINYTKEQISKYVGKENVVCVGILTLNFKKVLNEMIENETGAIIWQ